MIEIDEKTNQPALTADGRPRVKTSHTLNPVPLHVFAPGVPASMSPGLADAGLANLAATVLHLLGHEAPEDFQPSLLEI
jgi:2,3-bisphosphoglycerate-independent phosphoglycerate mutase